jgi:DNA-binding MarR family transcriptional regulator
MELQGRKTLGRFIALLYRMFTVYLNQELPPLKIGSGQYIFLAELFDEDGQSQDELTQRAYVNKANTARALAKLEEIGYVRRAADEKDQRMKRAFLQPAAQEVEDRFWQILLRWSDILSQDLSRERQDQLVADLEKMTDNAAIYLKRY